MSAPQSQYCAYAHFSAMLDRSGEDWLLAMIELLPDDYELYFDDSGTDSRSSVAVAACYVGTKRQWDEFTLNWNELKEQEGFPYFHMTDFMVNPSEGVKPFCDWDSTKKRRVYDRLARLIKIRAQCGFAVIVGKKDYDECVPAEMREHFGKDHYVWAIKCLLTEIESWRMKRRIKRPMQYIFSNIPKGKGTRGEVMDMWDSFDEPGIEERFGFNKDGFGFQNMRTFPPLQAADMLAWNMLDHYRNVVSVGRDDIQYMSRWFHALRHNFAMTLNFLPREDMEKFSKRIADFKNRTGKYPSRRVERLRWKALKRKNKGV